MTRDAITKHGASHLFVSSDNASAYPPMMELARSLDIVMIHIPPEDIPTHAYVSQRLQPKHNLCKLLSAL